MATFKALLLAGFLGAGSTCAADIVVIVNPAAVAPTKEQVADLYLGKSRAYTPLDQTELSPIRTEFYRKATGRDLAQVKMAWSRLVFTGKGLPPRELPGADAVKRAVAADPKAIGYIDKADVDTTVKAALTFD
jgi:ABC-type phosphate transport system substrate-binding protein